ncbi:MAG TPA: GerMN domain-containing protein [Pyrinomonadaceae bacterium]
MKRRFATRASVVLLCGFACLAPAGFAVRAAAAAGVNDPASQRAAAAGSYREASASDPQVLAAARFAVREEGRRRGARLTLVAVERAETQVVAGRNYRLRLSVSSPLRAGAPGRIPRAADRVESVDAVVYENLRGRLSLTSWRVARDAEPTAREVQVFLVALDDNGRRGRRIGCGDSLVAVTRTVNAPGGSTLRAALEELLALPHDNDAGLKNFWRGNNLRLSGVTLRNGLATIRIAGEGPFVAGVCDAPRITEQIRATARQFPAVRRVAVFVNGRTLEGALR